MFSATIFRLRPRLEVMEDRTLLSTFIVSNTGDSGIGSLRQAIVDSNNAVGTTNTIDFHISGTGVQTIVPLSSLPAITNPALIDGESQPGYSGTPLIELSGSQAGGGDGLTITGSGVTVRGLDINNFSQGAGIHLTGTGATGDWIYGNFLGTDPTGTQADPNNYGVEIDGGAANNLIGTNGDGVNDTAERNLLSGNLFAGLWVTGPGTDGNAVAGNFIGTDISGTIALNNATQPVTDSQYNVFGGGAVIADGASDNRIGTDAASVDDVGERNVIAGSNNDGIDIYGTGTDGNIVAGNFLGTDATGTHALGIDGNGVFLAEGASSNWVGVNADGGSAVGDERNVISGTGYDGVQISGGSDDNVVAGDQIGTNATGAVALGNSYDGVEIDSSLGNTIGGTGASAADVISSNEYAGVYFYSSSDNLVEGDFIGTDVTGTKALGNAVGGVVFDTQDNGSSIDNSIGGTSAVAGNLITDNGGPGVEVFGLGSVGNQITANRIFANARQAIELGDEGVTYNSPSPRQGPNNLQNFPIFATTIDGGLEGWLGGSAPHTTFRIDLYASAGLGLAGSGEAQDYLGSLAVTTDAAGQVTFAVPLSAPAGLPIITATATDPRGNTSEVSTLQATLLAPSLSLRAAANQSLVFSTEPGAGIAIEDPDAGPLDPVWSVTLSVSGGTLTLSTTAGLTGSGDGTGSLSYSGPLTALDAALDGMTYAPPVGPHVFATVTSGANSYGAPPLEAQFLITDGVFVVNTTADSGPGSLRQAILDAKSVIGGSVKIDFTIPGAGVQTIEPLSPFPPITSSVLIDGTTQPGFAGTPLIAFRGQSPGSSSPLLISGGDVTIRGLAIQSVTIDATTDEWLIGVAAAQSLTTQLSLLDSRGHVLVQSEGGSSKNPDEVIDEHLTAGDYSLVVEATNGQGTFTLTTMLTPAAAPSLPIPVGSTPSSIVAGDFTGDGHLDLAVANEYSNDVSVLLGNGDGTFQPAVNYAVGHNPTGIVAGDFNGDGHLDLAVANNLSKDVSVLLGNGDGTFQPQVIDAVGSGPYGIVAGDFTTNGHVDLAVTNQASNDVSILLGNGDGTFQRQVAYAVGETPWGIVTGDFNGGGRLDLAVANFHSNDVSFLLGNGDGTFQRQVTYAVGDAPWGIVTGDFTGNGHLSLATTDYGSDRVSVLVGNGDGTFQPQVTYAVGSTPNSIVAGDFTGDGRLDLAVANWGSNSVSVLLGNGDGTFQSEVEYAVGTTPDSMVAGDFNADGRLDLAVANENDNTVSVLLGNGVGTFPSTRQNVVGASPVAIVAAHFAGDGRLDLAVANAEDNTISVLLSNGDGTFQPAVEYPVGVEPSGIAAGDFNGDGRLDLAVADYGDESYGGTDPGGVSVLLGNGDGTFQPAVEYPVGVDPSGIVAGDFNGDGRLDLAVVDQGNDPTFRPGGARALPPGNDPGGVSVLLGNGDGTFQPAVQYAAGIDPDAIVAGDFTGNGRLDLAVADRGNELEAGTDPGEVSVLLGNADGTFQPAVQYAAGIDPDAIVAGDFTGAGHLDLAVANQGNEWTFPHGTDPGGVSVLLGNGDGTFQPPVSYTVGPASTGIAAGDFTGDGHLDLAVVGYSYVDYNNADVGEVSVLLGNGDGTFQLAGERTVGSYTLGGLAKEAIVAGDFNGDGRNDLAVENSLPDDVAVLLGNGDGTFVDPGQFATTPHATPLVADVNGDGTDDVLVVDGSGNILYRQGIPGQPGTFEPPVTVNPPQSDGANPSRDIAWIPNTIEGPLLASVDAHDDAVSLYAFRDGSFVRTGSLTTGQLPAQIIAADLTGDGWDDLVVRNAGDGTLSVFHNNPLGVNGNEPFLLAQRFFVGLGVSDVEVIDTNGNGDPELVVTNKLTGQLSVLPNWGNGTFAGPVPYRAGTGLSEIDPGSTPEVTSLEATAGVAAGSITPGGPTDLLTINPGSNTLDVLAGPGDGRFANPVTIQTPSPAQIVRMADFTGDSLNDLAVLTAGGLSVYLANGKGGFLPPTTYAVPPESDGLTVADVTRNGKLDLLVGDAYGDVLVLLGNGDGTFEPYHEANQAVELAVADLAGNGSKDIIYADQGLDRVVVDYGAGNSTVLANQSTGLLDPGAVALADLNGDGIPDLIVANSGSNNVLIYPGLGNGQFGPAVNDGNGYFVGTNPVGITVAYLTGALPDLVVADKGSNQVSILLNQSQVGGAISFSAGPRLNSGGSGPVSTVVGNFTGGAFPDLLVTNSQSNDVALLKGVGQGFFNDTNPTTFAVGANPVTSIVGNFDGQTDLLTVNAGSNDLTLISGFNGPDAVTTTIASGGVDPDAAFAFASGTGFEDLVVGNAGDGELALFEGGADGLGLASASTEPNVPDPTALAFSALTGGDVQFYAATAGRESAELVALSLGIETTTTSQTGETTTSSQSGAVVAAQNAVAQLVPLHESSLPLLATVLTLTIAVSGNELELGLQETEATAVAAFLSGTGISLGQSLSSQAKGGPGGDDNAESDGEKTDVAGTVPAVIAPWARFVLGLDQVLEQFQRENPNGVSGTPAGDSGTDHADSPPATGIPTQGGPTTIKSSPDQVPQSGEPDRTENASPSFGSEAIDAIIESFWKEDRAADSQERLFYIVRPSDTLHDEPLPIGLAEWPSSRLLTSDRIICEPRVAPRPALTRVVTGRRFGEVPPRVIETNKPEPAPALAFLVVATMAHEWVYARRWHRTIRLGRPGAPTRSGNRGNPNPDRPRIVSGAR